MKSVRLFVILVLAVFQLQAQKVGLNIGDKAPNIKMSSPDGKVYSLSDLKGQVVLIDFWASWCSPCRRENPYVVKAYHTYKDQLFKEGKGFTVFSVSLDRDKSSWKSAIAQDRLVWKYHVSDLKHWRSEAAKTYQVRGIPTNFLIDGEGVIIGKSLRGRELDKALERFVFRKKSQRELEKELKSTLTQLQESLSESLQKETDKKKRKLLKKRKKQIEKALKQSQKL